LRSAARVRWIGRSSRSRPARCGPRRIRFGEKLSLDELGPVIVNSDCTLRRIADWDEKNPHERELIARRLRERNAERLERCRSASADGDL
jgi:hypothetical protein